MPELRSGQVVERDGERYLVVGKTFSTKERVPDLASIVVECETLNVEQDEDGKVTRVSAWVPNFIERTDAKPDSLEAIVRRAKAGGVLQEKVRRGEEVEYLPTGAGKLSAAKKAFSGVIVGFYLSKEDSEKLEFELPEGSKILEPFHLTLIYLGEAEKLADRRELIEAVVSNFAKEFPPIHGTFGGIGRFSNVEEENRNALYASFDASSLNDFRQELEKRLNQVGVAPGSDHGFTPHVTLGYIPADAEMPQIELPRDEIVFDELTLGWADEKRSFQLAAEEAVSSKATLDDYPDESKKLRFVAQNHARGKSFHLDMRFEYKRGEDHFLRGWTVADQVAGAIEEPVTTMAAAERACANPANWKLDLKTGMIKQRETRAGVRRGSLRAFKKAAEIPADWLNVEGVTKEQDPGEPPPAGATVQYPGVFVILAKGECYWGAQKPWFQEWFLDGDWKGRWMFRLIKREGEKFWLVEDEEDCETLMGEVGLKSVEELAGLPVLTKAELLPPGKEEERPRTEAMWLLMQPEDQTPFILSRNAVKENWLPPKTVSCLPRKLRAAVPKALQYWNMERPQALEARRKLAEVGELGGTELKVMVLGEIGHVTNAEDVKAGRWRTLPDGRQVLVAETGGIQEER